MDTVIMRDKDGSRYHYTGVQRKLSFDLSFVIPSCLTFKLLNLQFLNL